MGKVRDALKLIAGRCAELLFPGLGREIDEERNTARAVRLKRAIVYARLRRAHGRGDAAGVSRALTAFWQAGAGDWYHDSFGDARFKLFQEQHAVAIDTFAGLLAGSDARFSRLVEIGCGDGRVLADCVGRLPSITQAVGLDVNSAVIARASSQRDPDRRLSFFNAEAQAWLTANPQAGTVVLSNNGVLEYLSQDNVDTLFQELAAVPPAAVILIEPAAPEHDLQNQADSFVFGQEYSFSHNHRRRLLQAGFDVVFERETHVAHTRLVLMIGVILCDMGVPPPQGRPPPSAGHEAHHRGT